MSLTFYPYIFGNNSLSTYSNTNLSADRKVAGKQTLNDAADIYNIVLYGVYDGEYPTVKIKGFIYSDNAGLPDTLIAVTNEVVGVYAGVPVYMPFASPVSLSAGDYWLGFITDTYFKMRASSYSTGINKYNDDTYADGPSDPFGSYSNNSYNREIFAAGEGVISFGISNAVSYSILSFPDMLNIQKAIAYAVLDDVVKGNRTTSIIIT